MPPADQIIYYILGAVGVVAVLALFFKPFRVIMQGVFRTLLGFAGLIAVNFAGSAIGFGVGVNLVNALIVGLLGIPGLGTLLILNALF